MVFIAIQRALRSLKFQESVGLYISWKLHCKYREEIEVLWITAFNLLKHFPASWEHYDKFWTQTYSHFETFTGAMIFLMFLILTALYICEVKFSNCEYQAGKCFSKLKEIHNTSISTHYSRSKMVLFNRNSINDSCALESQKAWVRLIWETQRNAKRLQLRVYAIRTSPEHE